MNYSLFIPSYKRPHEVINNPMLPYATILLADEEVDSYKASFDRHGVQPKRIITGNGFGISKARNRIMTEWTDEDFIVMIDDDTRNVRNLMMYTPRISTDPNYMLEVLHHTARLSIELGSPVFGYASTLNKLHSTALLPYKLRGRIDESVIGITDKTLRWDERLTVSTDIDITFESIKRSRLALVDNRYGWEHDRWTVGGLSAQRTVEVTNDNLTYLQNKWGRKFITPFKDATKSQSGLSVNVKLNI